MTRLFELLTKTARLMVGQPDYAAYVAHMENHHPDQPVMSKVAFFRTCEQARYGGGNGRCC